MSRLGTAQNWLGITDLTGLFSSNSNHIEMRDFPIAWGRRVKIEMDTRTRVTMATL